MKCYKYDIAAFTAYLKPIEFLETSLQLCDLEVEFHLRRTTTKMRYIEIHYHGKVGNSIFIEGNSPAQAIKDIAEAVRL
jgi:hypothetical protein